MSRSMNEATVLGHLGADPDIRQTQAGKKVANFTLATSESWTDQQTGEKREQTEWHRIVIWGDGICSVVEKYLHKGSKCLVRGKMQTRKWQDQNGTDKYTTEIVVQGFKSELILLDPPPQNGGDYQPAPQAAPRQPAGAKQDFSMDLDDEVPF